MSDSEDERETLGEWLEESYDELGKINMKELADALYAFSERGMWVDSVDSMSVDHALDVWALVETIKREGAFPSEFKM